MNKTVQIAICDTNEDDLGLICSILTDIDTHNFEITRFRTAKSFLLACKPNRFQLVFVAWTFDTPAALQIAAHLRHNAPTCGLVVTTHAPIEQINSELLHNADILQYPIVRRDIINVLYRLGLQQQRRICTVKIGRARQSICVDDLQFVEVTDKHCLLYMTDGVLLATQTLQDIFELIDAPQFVKCHRSYIVNLDYVLQLHRDFTMVSGDTVYISRLEYWRVKRAFAAHQLLKKQRAKMALGLECTS